jgi:hypothetical protein
MKGRGEGVLHMREGMKKSGPHRRCCLGDKFVLCGVN